MTHDNNIEYMHPDIIELCVNCTSVSCSRGECQAVLNKIREIKGPPRPNQKVETFEHNGEVHTLKEWASILGIRYSTIIDRRSRGETQEDWFRPIGQKKRGVAGAQ